ncbi:MAG: zf-HC2 domain-containing protein [Ignavibacteria bacterium]
MKHNDEKKGTTMKYNNCEEVELLVDDYLEGMISTEDRQKMEEHLKGCPACKKYLEETVILIEKTALIAREDEKEETLLAKDKQQELWSGIEAKINSKIPEHDPHIYNMNGFEDEYIPLGIGKNSNKKNKDHSTPGRVSAWGSMRYYFSGIAAVLILAFVIFGVNRYMKSRNNVELSSNIVEVSGGPKWMVTSLKGSPLINNLVMKAIDSLGVGGYVTTDDSSKAELYVAGLGSVIIEPNSRVKLTKSVEGEHRIQLDYGAIDANINAKPRTFFVDAPTVTAVDLGCSYKFSVDKGGDGLLYVRTGKVSLESASGRESVVPEGKFCVTKQDIGPGTPFREDSSPQLKKALMEFDFGNCGGQCIKTILNNSKKTDAVTLVNMMPRVEEQYRVEVYNKVANYCPPPKHTPKDSIPKFNNLDDIDEWVDKIMDEVHTQLEENMARVEENMKKFDSEKWQKDFDKNWQENVKKNWNFDYNFQGPSGDSLSFNFNNETTPTPEEMEELNQEMEEMQRDLKVDNEEFKREMEKVKEEMKRVNEKIKQDMEEVKKQVDEEKMKNREEMQKQHKESEKNRKPMDTGDDDDNDK